jgi:hypothetical protein
MSTHPHPASWNRALAALLPLLLLVLSPAAGADVAHSKEYQIKAAFVLNFAKFLEWPENRFASDQQPIAIGIIGPTPLAAELESIVKDRKVHGRSVLVRTASSADDVRNVHLLFVGAGESAVFATVKDTAQNSGVLTVGESPEFEAAGGMITFIIEGDKVRFAINMGSAEQAHLRISAQLQQLATAVRKAR